MAYSAKLFRNEADSNSKSWKKSKRGIRRSGGSQLTDALMAIHASLSACQSLVMRETQRCNVSLESDVCPLRVSYVSVEP